MAQITPEIRRAFGHAASLVPSDTLAKIAQAELLDRLAHARQLVQKAQAAGASPAERRGFAEQARAVMRAQPRADTERSVAAAITKAAGLGNTGQADALRRSAQQLLADHPPAPRREDAVAVAKAAKSEPQCAVYDSAGQLLGLCDPAEIMPVGTSAEDFAKIAKAGRQGRAGVARRAAAGRPPARR